MHPSHDVHGSSVLGPNLPQGSPAECDGQQCDYREKLLIARHDSAPVSQLLQHPAHRLRPALDRRAISQAIPSILQPAKYSQ